MKATLLLVVLPLFLSFCQQQGDGVIRIEFSRASRSFREKHIFTPDSVKIISEGPRATRGKDVARRRITPDEWTSLLESLPDYPLNNLSSLEAPGSQRSVDAAATGTIMLTDMAGNSFSHEFDDYTPHKSLQPLMKAIRRIPAE